MIKLTKLAVGIGTALALSYGANTFAAIPAIGAIADASLTLSSFRILAGNGALGGGTQLNVNGVTVPPGTGNVNVTSNQSFATVQACVTGGVCAPAVNFITPAIGGAININQASGVGYVPGSLLTGNPASTFAGASSVSNGNALIFPGPGDTVPVEAQVSLKGANLAGLSSAKQTLNTQFTVILTTTQTFQLSFQADGFLRTALGQAGITADAAYSWNAKVTHNNPAGAVVTDMLWTPDGTLGTVGGGSCVAALTCKEFADAFSLNQSLNALSTQDNVQKDTGQFEIELALNPGIFNFSISHLVSADATTPAAIPEPTTLALLGLGLVGAGVSRRRKS